jgi:transposase
MNPSVTALDQQREHVLEQMRSLDTLRRGSLSEQFFKYKQAGKTLRRGPYFLLQGFFRGKKFAERIPAEKAGQVAQQVENYQRFQALAERFVTLTDEMTRSQDQPESKKNSRHRR